MGHIRRHSRLLAASCVALGGAAAVLIAMGITGGALAAIVGATALGAAGWATDRTADLAFDADHELIARMSHELRTPLTSVLGILDLLCGSQVAIDAEENAELLTLARSEAEHMEHLVANLHAASRIARHLLEPVTQPVDMPGLIARVIDRFPDVARRTYLPSGKMTALADPRLTTQILTNLVQNVQRYAPEGEVVIAVERRSGELAVVISDDGPGISSAAAHHLFTRGASDHGLGIGLSLSRELAEVMGGHLDLEASRRRGATFALRLPLTDLAVTSTPDDGDPASTPVVAHSPRARLLVDLAAAFSERSLERTMAGLHRLYVELLGAAGTMLMIPVGNGFLPVSAAAAEPQGRIIDTALTDVLRTGSPGELDDLRDSHAPHWRHGLDGDAALLLPVIDVADASGVLVVSFAHRDTIPHGRARDLAAALAKLAAFAVHRSKLVQDVAYERSLRSSVMESLPIAISVFSGDPPAVVDWNQRERRMLGITDDSQRPSDLEGSQRQFEVRFADGTPLTVDNAPATAAIRTGRSTGPFLLLVRRADGTEITTRTYCAPFFAENGTVAGAVVTSEELDVAQPELTTDLDLSGTPGG